MSSEAKVGLLVGLAFVFVISFLINGIPRIGSSVNNNELTTNMIKPQRTGHALAARERKAIKQVQSFRSRTLQLKKPQQTEQTIRFQMPLPKTSAVIQSSSKPTQVKQEKILVKNKTIKKPKSRINLPRHYIVQQGDNLALIAKRFYGPEKGNKITNIEKIYNANSNILSGPDEVYVGQKLIIPALDTNKIQQGNTNKIFSAKMFRQVKTKDNTKNKKHPGFHIVRDGDSLWQIAELHLGNGGRYKEVARLNATLLDDENNLSVGMKLDLPPR